MKFRMTFNLLAMVVVAVIPSHAAGDSMPNAVEDQSGRRGGYAQSLPRLSRLREAIEADMQQTDVAGERTEISALEPVTVESGFVIYKGRYIPPPYTLRSERGTIYINELKLPQKRPGQFFRRFANMRQANRGLHNRDANHIEHHLREDGLLICSRNDPIAFVSAYQAASVLEILLSDESDDVKAQKLMQTDTPWIAPERWASLIETFDGPAELYDRVQALRQRQADFVEKEADYELHWLVLSAMTFSGFILAVWALGTLISCRPPMLQGPQSTAFTEISCRQVVSLVVLIAVLNMYDLTCTLVAHNAGGLWELNPFASAIIHQNAVIVAFKLSLTIGAAILLLVARRHKLAQIGSWWAGVLYTVLILRWMMFNSMFL